MRICPVESLRAWHGWSRLSPAAAAAGFTREPDVPTLSLQGFRKFGNEVTVVPTPDAGR